MVFSPTAKPLPGGYAVVARAMDFRERFYGNGEVLCLFALRTARRLWWWRRRRWWRQYQYSASTLASGGDRRGARCLSRRIRASWLDREQCFRDRDGSFQPRQYQFGNRQPERGPADLSLRQAGLRG